MISFHLLPTFLASFVVDGLQSAERSFLRNPSNKNVLQHQRASASSVAECPYDPPTGPIETTLCDYESLESVNDALFSNVQQLVQTPFFKYFRVDLYRECPFWQENGFCMHRECGITSVNESDIPERWRAAALSRIEKPSKEQINALEGCYYRDADFCYLDNLTEGDYIDLTANPEQFTGYSGPSSHRVWSSIYDDNCFGIKEADSIQEASSGGDFSSSGSSLGGLALKSPKPSGSDGNLEQCLETQVYYKIISGMHASISMHICNDMLDQRTGERRPDLRCFIDRIASHPERLRYIYFNTVLMLRAVTRAGPYLAAYDYCTGDHQEDKTSLELVRSVVDIAESVGRFDETVLFRGENAKILKEEFKAHFRNVSRTMDCVGCDKCRLWGKVQTTGLGVAMKLLFELDEAALDPVKNPHLLQKAELVALMNTLHRFSESLQAFDNFREMWAENDKPSNETHAGREDSHGCRNRFSLLCLLNEMRSQATNLVTVCESSVHACAHFFSELMGELRGIMRHKGGVPSPDL